MDDGVAFICAAKGLPYSEAEWAAEVLRLDARLADAQLRLDRARETGYCAPEQYDEPSTPPVAVD
jgi:hypothetical protein